MNKPPISKHRLLQPRHDPEDAKVKISVVNRYLDSLRETDLASTKTMISNNLGTIVQSLRQSVLIEENELVALDTVLKDSLALMDLFAASLQHIDTLLQNIISERKSWYFSISYDLYNSGKEGDSDEYILNRRFSLSPKAESAIHGRIAFHCKDWRFPGVILRPGLEPWVRNIAATLTPLYLLDQSWALLEPVKEHFPKDYLQRLRMEVITETDNTVILDCVPDNQIGFFLAYNFFNHKPLEIITHYLNAVIKKLRPGGTFAFTINDGDRPGGAELVENRYACYIPGSMIRTLAKNIGYEVSFEYHIDAAVTWLELRRPGDLDSLRGGAVLTKTFEKN